MRIVKTKLTLEWKTLFCSNMFQGRAEVWVVSWAKALPVGSAGSGKVWILKTAWGAFGEGCTQVQSYHQGKVVAGLLVSMLTKVQKQDFGCSDDKPAAKLFHHFRWFSAIFSGEFWLVIPNIPAILYPTWCPVVMIKLDFHILGLLGFSETRVPPNLEV